MLNLLLEYSLFYRLTFMHTYTVSDEANKISSYMLYYQSHKRIQIRFDTTPKVSYSLNLVIEGYNILALFGHVYSSHTPLYEENSTYEKELVKTIFYVFIMLLKYKYY